MITGPSYSTKPLRRRPAQEQFFQVNVEDEWDFIAEAVVGSNAQYSTQLNQLIVLLESHGIIVHKLSAAQSGSLEVPHDVHPSFAVAPSVKNAAEISADEVLFSRNVALVHGVQVIEAPPSSHTKGHHRDSQSANLLFTNLENAGADVIRWPSGSSVSEVKERAPDEKLVDVGENQRGSDKEEEGARFCPSDILIVSPTLLITRLSTYTNNKGLEYLWSVLSQPLRGAALFRDPRGFGAFDSTPSGNRRAHTTTLLVRITDSDAPSGSSPSTETTTSPRSSTIGAGSRSSESAYIPLSRALVPISGKVMLYDPALIAEDEARRLKSVLDRVQADPGEIGRGNGADFSASFAGHSSKKDSVMSYGTFGSLDRTDENGWQFISADGLHSTSILLISRHLALLNVVSPSSSEPSAMKYHGQKDLNNVSQILESLGIRAVKLSSADTNNWPSYLGVRDVVLVLRRESDIDSPDYENNQSNRDGQQGEESPADGCMETICASLSAWFCGSLTYSGESEADDSDHF